MARDFGPFPSKLMYEVVNRRMQRALAEATASTGFAKSGQGAVTAGTGAELVIAAYPDGALVDGLYVENPASETVSLDTNTESTNPRIDRLVLRLDMAAETIAPFQIVGTPAASPSTPALTQTATVFDMPLCQYRLPGSGSAQNPGSIVDERQRTKRSSEGYVDLVTDAGGNLVIPHGLGAVPVSTQVTPGPQLSPLLNNIISMHVTNYDATNLVVYVRRDDTNAGIPNQQVRCFWRASV